MRPIGFSTGALAHGDFRSGLAILGGSGINVVELSALRDGELEPLVEALGTLDLRSYDYIAVHAPSCFSKEREVKIVAALGEICEKGWPIVIHPDTIHDYGCWRSLGDAVCIENMDNRKSVGRSASELERIFTALPNAKFCFDIGHARQFDSTMTGAYLLLTRFGTRLKQVHVSEVNTRSKHDVLSSVSIAGFREVAYLIPVETPLILETPASQWTLQAEMARAREALPIGAAVHSSDLVSA